MVYFELHCIFGYYALAAGLPEDLMEGFYRLYPLFLRDEKLSGLDTQMAKPKKINNKKYIMK